MNSNLASSGNSSYMYRTTFSLVHSHFIKKSFRIRYLIFGTWNLVLLEVPSQSTHSQGNSIAACQIPSTKYQLPVTASAPTRSATSVSPGTACFWPFLLLYSASRQSCAGAGPGNASVQTPCARAASASAKLRQSCRPVRGPSSHALDSRLSGHQKRGPAGPLPVRLNPSLLPNLLCASAACAGGPGKGW